MRFELLGPVRGLRGDEELDLGSPQQRLTLAALLLAEGRVVGQDQLIDILWADTPPKTAANVVRQYLSRLRAVLGAEVIQSVAGGYRCAAETDVADFHRLLAAAAQAPVAEAHALLRQALDHWRGEPLAGLPGLWAQAQRTRLTEARLVALESRFDTDLATGRHAEVIGELTALHAAHPTRERLSGQLMLALKRAGRQAEAIGVYAETRLLLAEEFGVDPSAELAAAYQQVIAAEKPASASAPTPRQLPAVTTDFTGRAPALTTLAAALRGSGALPIAAVSGQGGVGKTTLALRAAHTAAEHFPDGQLFADLGGASAEPITPEAALASFLHALGHAEPPDGLEERAALFRSTLADRRVLVVLDNAADLRQVLPLLPGSPACAVLITSRVRLAGLAGATHVDLDVLNLDEARALLAAVAGQARVTAEPQAALDLIGACAFLPLAIRIAAARLAARPAWTLGQLAARLADERRRLAELRAGDLAVEACFALGYDQLRPDLARAFRLLAVPNAAALTLPMVEQLLDTPDAEDLCERLVDLNLLQSPWPGHYRLHDLLRVYARSRPDDEMVQQMALLRLCTWLKGSVVSAIRLAAPGHPVVEGLDQGVGRRFAGLDEVTAWLDTSMEAVLSCLDQAIRLGKGDLSRMGALLEMLAVLRESSTDYRPHVELLLTEAERRGDEAAQAYARSLLLIGVRADG
ncbi:AfsR/SARP family transcriptional regulator [Nonomuraea typhae]|uniref:AfsR/SARP family transcriptional regulator n=1 Tax=Nonomuraea typhae TaxID=2603600 RepID=UPI0012FA4343|nr:AfsR/SARP family transcriptional regulator [Nonomuraea typhae]